MIIKISLKTGFGCFTEEVGFGGVGLFGFWWYAVLFGCFFKLGNQTRLAL